MPVPAASTPGPVVDTIVAHLQKFNESGKPLGPDTVIATDLAIDSMAMMEMVFALEEKYDVSIPLNRLGDTRTIAELAALVEGERR